MSDSLIFSTYVEVFPHDKYLLYLYCNFLHVCGGVSLFFSHPLRQT